MTGRPYVASVPAGRSAGYGSSGVEAGGVGSYDSGSAGVGSEGRVVIAP